MRTILFRGKRINDGEWVEGDLLQWKSKGKAAITPQNGDEWSNPYDFEVIPETVGQFTGLLDKNCKKIFEGDKAVVDSELFMCSEHGFEGFVTYLECGFYIDNGSEAHRLWSDAYQVKIIGNIHDK